MVAYIAQMEKKQFNRSIFNVKWQKWLENRNTKFLKLVPKLCNPNSNNLAFCLIKNLKIRCQYLIDIPLKNTVQFLNPIKRQEKCI